MSTELDCLMRDGYRCFRCGRPLANFPHNCHHRLTAGLGPDTPENRISLCGFGNNLRNADGVTLCHGFAHQNGTLARAEGWIISRHAKEPPELIPVRHWQLGMVLLTADCQITDLEGHALAVGTERGERF